MQPRNANLNRAKQSAAVRAFWDDRAREFGSNSTATLHETNLRQLEIRTMQRLISQLRPSRVLDVGCGNGVSTIAFASTWPSVQFTGVDFSSEMIAHVPANQPPNCRFAVADVTVPSSLPGELFDLIITQRCLQNLPDYKTQTVTIGHLKSKLGNGGSLALMECSKDGVIQLNRVRRQLGRSAINGVEPWHNCFFHDQDLVNDFGARVVYFSSTYMLLTRLVSSRLGRWAWRLPHVGRFGYDRLYVIR